MITFTIAQPTFIFDTGVITAVLTGANPPFRYYWEYEGGQYPGITDTIEGYTGFYRVTIIDGDNKTHTQEVELFPTTITDEIFCVSCTENNTRGLCAINNYGSFTASFTPSLEGWTCFHDYIYPIITLSNYVILLDNRELHALGDGDRGVYAGITHNSYIDIVNVTQKPNYLNTVLLFSETYNRDNLLLRETSTTYLTIRNNHQTTGKIKLNKQNSQLIEGYYAFNEIRDIAKKDTLFVKTIHDDFELIESGLIPYKHSHDKGHLISFYNIARVEFENREDMKFTLLNILFNTTDSER